VLDSAQTEKVTTTKVSSAVKVVSGSKIRSAFVKRSTLRVHHVNLAGLFGISPIVGIKNCYTHLQEGKVICMGN
jgi:hypothetical protein